MRPVVVSQTGVGARIIPVDYLQVAFSVGVGVTVTGTVTFSIEHTYDDALNPAVTPIWFAPTADAGKTANYDKGFVTPIRAVRLNVTAGTGTAVMTVLQGDPR